MIHGPISDRERYGLRGPVKTVVDESSTTVFDRDGRILEWRGNTSHGIVSERTYVYDPSGRLIRIAGSDGDQTEEFHYDEQGRKTGIRRIPARPDRQQVGFGISVWFESISDGCILGDGGTVTTTYNERDQLGELQLHDDEGTLVYRVVYAYDAGGRLTEEKLVSENLPFPRAFREQVPAEQRAAALAQMKTQIEAFRGGSGLFGNAERSYVYNEQGRIVERHMRLASGREDVVWTYNGQGDMTEWTRVTSGFTSEHLTAPEQRLQVRYAYQYDDRGNWMSRTVTSRFEVREAAHMEVRQLTYHE